MRKLLHILPILFLSALCLVGCGKREKISDKKYEQALDIYQEYYRNLCQEADDCYIQLSLDANGFPFIMTAELLNSSYSNETMVEIDISTIVKGEVFSLLNETTSFDEFDTEYVLYSDGIVGILNGNEKEWYQVRNGELEEVAYYDVASEIVTFYMGKRDIEIDLTEENPVIYEKEYESICKKIYGQAGPGAAYGKKVWLWQFLSMGDSEHTAFLQSPPVGWSGVMFDSSDFRKMVSKLKQKGSMANEEFLTWHYNYVVDIGGNDMWNYPSAAGLIFRNPMLLNDIDDFMLGDKGTSQMYLLSYLTNTKDWKTAENLDLFGEFDKEQLEGWQLLCLFLRMESFLTEESYVYDEYLQYGRTYLNEYLHAGAIDPENQFTTFCNGWTWDVQYDKRTIEDLILLKHMEDKFRDEYAALTDGKEGVKYLSAGVELIDKMPELLRSWREEYISSGQLQQDYEEHYNEYVKEQYELYIRQSDDWDEVRDEGYFFVRMDNEDTPCLIRFYWHPVVDMIQVMAPSIDVLSYSDNQVREYHFTGEFYWIDDIKGIYIDVWEGEYKGIYEDVYLWTLKNGSGYMPEGKWARPVGIYDSTIDGTGLYYYIASEEKYEGESDKYFIEDWHSSSSEQGVNWEQVSEWEYIQTLQEYADTTKFPKIIGPEQEHSYKDSSKKFGVKPGQMIGRTYASIDEAFNAWLQNPDGGIEVIGAEGSSQGNNTVQDTKMADNITTGEVSSMESEKPILDIVVADEVNQIRAWYNEIQNNLDSYMIATAPNNMINYYRGTELLRMDAAKGYDNWDYTRQYYFRNGNLYFAFVFNGSEEHRLYFKEDQLIRYIDENKNTYDYGDTDQFSEWSVPVLNEAYNLYDEYIN